MTDIVTADMETFYGDNYTLSSMTTEAYIRDPRFETILCGFKINDEKSYCAVGHEDVAHALRDLNIPKRVVLAHHAQFDGLILSHHYGLAPKMWLDTLGMARAVHGANGGLSLAKLATRYGIGAKGEEVINARNMRLADFGPVQLRKYGEYCGNDCELEYQLFLRLLPHFSKTELMINDQTIRMFTEPRLRLDVPMLERYREKLSVEKMTLLLQAGVQRPDLMSNERFAECLRELGVEPPLKVSPTWLKKSDAERESAALAGKNGITYAFAKSDPAMQQLQEHPDERVQILVEARLKNKTTIAEKGAERLIDMASRGAATVYLKYAGASGTWRHSGGDSLNWQGFKRGSDLRNATMAPDGSVCVVADSSTIEARWLDWLAGQDDMVEVYRHADAKTGPDMYCTLAEKIYKRPINKKDNPAERQMGKVAKLGLGFGMGDEKFISTVRAQAKDADGKPLKISAAFSKQVVGIYRESHPQVKKLWKRCEQALAAIAAGEIGVNVDFRGIVKTCKDGLEFPGGIKIHYPDLKKVRTTHGPFEFEWEFWNGKTRERIFGAKVAENCLSAGTLVLTSRGWIAIELVRAHDLVHDGVEFVRHGGTIFKSVQKCVTIDGVHMTPNHEVLTDEGWKPALDKPRPYRPNLRGAYGTAYCGQRRKENAMAVPMRLRAAGGEGWCVGDERVTARGTPELWVHDGRINAGEAVNTRHVETPSVLGVAQHDRPLRTTLAPSLRQLRRAWDQSLRAMARGLREFLGRYGANIPHRAHSGAQGERPRLLAGELFVGDLPCASAQPAQQLAGGYSEVVCRDGHRKDDIVLPLQPQPAARPVYDILNAGPRHRFVVRGDEGPFIVHNCIQCLARITVFNQCLKTAGEVRHVGARWVHSMHDEGIFIAEDFYAPWVQERLEENFRTSPDYAATLPLNCEAGFHQRYGMAKL